MAKLRELQKQNPEAEAIRESSLRQGVLVGSGGVYENVIREFSHCGATVIISASEDSGELCALK